MKYREDELNVSLEAIKVETEAAVEMRARVDKMIEALQELLHISQQCLVKRYTSAFTCDNFIRSRLSRYGRAGTSFYVCIARSSSSPIMTFLKLLMVKVKRYTT